MRRSAYILFIVLSVIALDQITKFLIIEYLPLFDSIEVFSFFHIVNIRNTGAAFGMFKSLGSSFFIGLSIIAIIFIINLLIRNIYDRFGLSLILGGAIGNLSDRILYGKVVDFMDFSIGSYHWPSFNVADSALTVGIILILLKSVLKK
jgi:signal peptidase II